MTDREFMELALIEAEKAYKEGEIPILIYNPHPYE